MSGEPSSPMQKDLRTSALPSLLYSLQAMAAIREESNPPERRRP